uniref:Ras-like GTP-binding protein Rho1 n=2 Tax=Lygus hesperus TaxID=30085 RepID=A0A146LNX6_LYGHE
MNTKRKKLVIVGDGNCGKTSLLLVFSSDTWEETWEPTVIENYVANIVVGTTEVQLCMWDTAGQEDFNHLRTLCYPGADVILMCFAIDNQVSLHNVWCAWMPEIEKFCPEVPVILVGTKKDLRDDPGALNLVKTKAAKFMAAEVNAYDYLECSAKTKVGVREVFITAAKAALFAREERKKRKKNKGCVLL